MLAAPVDQKQHRLTSGLLNRALKLVDCRDRLPVHFLDDVASLHAFFRGATRRHVGDDDAFDLGRKGKLPRNLRRKLLCRNAEARS
jgi:hypothetical protein